MLHFDFFANLFSRMFCCIGLLVDLQTFLVAKFLRLCTNPGKSNIFTSKISSIRWHRRRNRGGSGGNCPHKNTSVGALPPHYFVFHITLRSVLTHLNKNVNTAVPSIIYEKQTLTFKNNILIISSNNLL